MNVEVQIASRSSDLPDSDLLAKWAKLAMQQRNAADVVIRLVDETESAELNETYRHKKGATNVLSFPFEVPAELPETALTGEMLGDMVICAPIVSAEAKEQGKPILSHWAHMVIHGCLHLQGYDHIIESDASIMEGIEVELLNNIGIKNPYEGE
ncbi:MAG: rRNA maturation RNase YbeY [Piscirickettsiaceae bacterium]|nr:MAG: rRNA maturation RNase YbeY [Piscirickettsiaceae bacterium]